MSERMQIIKEIIEKHRFAPMSLEDEEQCIGCDWKPKVWYLGDKEHITHVAEILEALMAARAAQAQIDVLEGVAAGWEEALKDHYGPAFAEALRVIAEQIRHGSP